MPTLPKVRTEELVVQELPDEVLVYDLKNHKTHCLNQTAALVWKHCNGKRTAGDIARLLAKQSGGPASEEVVWLALRQLGANHLLAEKLTPPAEMARMSRREVVRKLGLAGAVVLPTVVSIIAPQAVEAATLVVATCVCSVGNGFSDPTTDCPLSRDKCEVLCTLNGGSVSSFTCPS
jgi:hypothetical protein